MLQTPITETWLDRVERPCHGGVMVRRIQTRLTRRDAVSAILAAGIFPAVYVRPAVAGPTLASDWSESSHSALRLIDGGPVEGQPGVHRVGIVVRMRAGFKTYWRHPGDSGVPPVFQFDGSDNLKEAVVHFPAPRRFDDGAGGMSFGYLASGMIFPVTVTAVDPGKPVALKFHADYAVCEKLCVPASADIALVLSSDRSSPFAEPVKQAMAAVPLPVALGSPGRLKIIGFRRATQPDQILVDVVVPDGELPELFMEGETPWFFERRTFDPGRPDHPGTFTVGVIERSKASNQTGTDVVLTLVTPHMSIEVRTRLDVALVTP